MSAAASPLGYGLYFLDVLACTLFCLAFALAGARGPRELAIPVELPRAEAARAVGSGLAGASLVVRGDPAAPELLLDGERVDLATLEARLRRAPPPALRIRAEVSPLGRAIALAHAAGVLEIELAYADARAGGGSRR
jgi:hypothetical protein